MTSLPPTAVPHRSSRVQRPTVATPKRLRRGELRRGHLALAFGDLERARNSFDLAERRAHRRPLANAWRTLLTGCHAGRSDLAAHSVLESHADLRRAGAVEHLLFAASVLFEGARDSAAARRAYGRFGTHQLRRIVAVHRGSRDLPELAEVDAAELQVLRGFRLCLEDQHSELLTSFTCLWRRGEPGHDLVLGNDEIIALCAWCRRRRAKDGHWLSLHLGLPLDAPLQVTHGICASCAEGLLS